MSMQDTFDRLGTLCSRLPGNPRVFWAGGEGDNALPDGIAEVPAVLIFPTNITGHDQIPGNVQRLQYNVKIQIVTASGDMATRSNEAVSLVEILLALLAANTRLGSLPDGTADRTIRLVGAAYGDLEYATAAFLGWDCDVEVVEQTVVIFAGGD